METLFNLHDKLHGREAVKIPSTPSCSKRASITIILRLEPTQPIDEIQTASRFEELRLCKWARKGRLQVLFIRRAKNAGDRWSGHVAFPGGKAEEGESDRDAAERETFEEIGYNLGSRFAFLGQLNDVEVRTPASSKRLMVLCSFVYLLLEPVVPRLTLSKSEVDYVSWVPFDMFCDPTRQTWRPVYMPMGRYVIQPNLLGSSNAGMRLTRILETFVTKSVGHLIHNGLVIPGSGSDELPLWGLSLAVMTEIVGLSTTFDQKTVMNSLKTRALPRHSHLDIDVLVSLFTNGNRSLKSFVNGDPNSKYSLSMARAILSAVLISIIGKIILLRETIRASKKAYGWIKSLL